MSEIEYVDQDVIPTVLENCQNIGSTSTIIEGLSSDILFCPKTNIAFLERRPTVAACQKFYENEFSEAYNPTSEKFVNKSKHRLTLVEDTLQEFNIDLHGIEKSIDFGCGFGLFTAGFQEQYGGEIYAVEPSALARSHAESQGVKILGDNLFDFDSSETQFDVAILIHVLEHLHYPMQTLNMIKGVLNDTGILIIQVPDFETIMSLSRSHIFQYTGFGLHYLLSQCGFSVIAIKSTHGIDGRICTAHLRNLTVVASLDPSRTISQLPDSKSLDVYQGRQTYWRQEQLAPRYVRRMRKIIRAFRKPSV